MSNQQNESIIVVSTVRNVETNIIKEINNCKNALSSFKTIYFYLVESDSADGTLQKLSQLKQNIQNFSYISLGKLDLNFPDRLERIRYCRNIYINYVRSFSSEKIPRYVMVVDLDGMNNALNAKSIESCFVRKDWDVVLSNQTFGYYDILALRHQAWQTGDWTEEYNDRKNKLEIQRSENWLARVKYFLALDKLKSKVLYSKMIKIKKNSPWIEVQSGFGGAAIYKTNVLQKYDYSKEFISIETDHVSLHRKLIRDGGKIFINPSFINSHFNTYNINRFFVIRILRTLVWNHKKLYSSKIYNFIKNFKIYLN